MADLSNFAAMQDLNWYGKQSDAEGLTLGSLAVTAPMIKKEMKVVEIINQHLTKLHGSDFATAK